MTALAAEGGSAFQSLAQSSPSSLQAWILHRGGVLRDAGSSGPDLTPVPERWAGLLDCDYWLVASCEVEAYRGRGT